MKKLGIILGVILFVGVLLVAGVRAYVIKKAFANLTPEEIEQYEVWRTEKLKFAPEDLEVKAFSDTTLAAVRAFQKLREDHGARFLEVHEEFKKLSKSPGMEQDSPEWKALREKFRALEPMADAFEAVVCRPDYEMHAFLPSAPRASDQTLPAPDLNVFVDARILSMKSRFLSDEGKDAEALLTAENMIKCSKRHKYSAMITQIIGLSIFRVGTKAWHSAVTRCDDPALLRRALERQNALTPQGDFFPTDIPALAQDHLGLIMEGKRQGIETDVQGLTGMEIMAASLRVQAEYMEKRVLPLVKDDTLEKVLAPNFAKSYKEQADMYEGRDRNIKETLQDWIAMAPLTASLYGSATGSFHEMRTNGDSARVDFDLLRIQTARKLFALEKGREASGIAELVPGYLPEAPKDLFDKGNQGYGFAKTGVYSIGPDGQDQGGALVYDSTNGTRSAGDILLKVR